MKFMVLAYETHLSQNKQVVAEVPSEANKTSALRWRRGDCGDRSRTTAHAGNANLQGQRGQR